TINLTTKNVGKSPAFDIATEAHGLVLGPANFSIGAMVTKACSELRQKQNTREVAGQHGEVLFPDETLSQTYGLLLVRTEIERGAEALDGKFFAPAVIICTDYRSPITGQSHATGIAYVILKTNSQAPMVDEVLKIGEFGVARSPFGSFAD